MKTSHPLLFILSAAIFAFASCEESENTALSPGLNITIGQACGWCAGQDELAISKETWSYYYDYACGDSLDVPLKFFNTPEQDWEKLVLLLDKDDFSAIDLNSCNVCFDGCDTWVKVEDARYSHTIQFGEIADVPASQHEFVSTLHTLIIQAREDFGKK